MIRRRVAVLPAALILAVGCTTDANGGAAEDAGAAQGAAASQDAGAALDAGASPDAGASHDGGAPTAAQCEALTSSEACHEAGCSAFVGYYETALAADGTCEIESKGHRCLLTTQPWSNIWSGVPSTWYRWVGPEDAELMQLGGLVCDNEIVGWRLCEGSADEPEDCACAAKIRC